MTGAWLVAIGGLLIGFVLSTLFHALRDYSLRKLEALASQNGDPVHLRAIVDDSDAHARSIGMVRVIANMIAVFAIAIAMGPIVVVETVDGVAIAQVQWLAAGSAFLVSVLLVFLGAMLLPISLARHAGERIIHSSVGIIRAIHMLMLPLAWLGVFDVAVKRLVGEGATTEHEELEDELLSAVSEGERGGRIGASERVMIEGVVELAEKTVAEIMTPRTDVEGLELTNDLSEISTCIKTVGHSRIPIYEGDLDHLRGVLYAKDLLPFVGESADDFELAPILREIFFVPESKPLNELLVELQTRNVHIAIVLDEYGGTAGLVTLEDLLEEIVGEIRDEFEPESDADPEIVIDPQAGTADVDARANIDDANDMLASIGIEIPEDDDYDTVGGYVLSTLGHIPVAGEVFEAETHRYVVLEAEPTRVNRLRIEAVQGDAAEAEEQAESDAPAVRVKEAS